MTPDTRIERRGALLESDVNGELMALSIERGCCYGFNATASALWRLLDRPRTLDELCRALMTEHDVDRQTCLADCAAVLERMAAEQLVTLTPP